MTDRRKGDRREATAEGQRVEHHVSDPWDYYVPAPGKEGVKIGGAYVSPLHKHLVSQIIQSGKTRFTTESEFIRAAIVYFLNDKFGKKFFEGRQSRELEVMLSHIARGQHLARAYDLDKFKNTSKDALLKMWAMGAEQDAVAYFEETLTAAKHTHKEFGARVREWLMADPQLGKVKEAWRKTQRGGGVGGGGRR